jgi:hypothetical protein
MTTNRERLGGARQRAPAQPDEEQLDRRRAQMQASESHSGSVPRGNQQPEREIMGSHRIAWDRLLGH